MNKLKLGLLLRANNTVLIEMKACSHSCLPSCEKNSGKQTDVRKSFPTLLVQFHTMPVRSHSFWLCICFKFGAGILTLVVNSIKWAVTILFSDLYQEHSQDQLLFLPGKLNYKCVCVGGIWWLCKVYTESQCASGKRWTVGVSWGSPEKGLGFHSLLAMPDKVEGARWSILSRLWLV